MELYNHQNEFLAKNPDKSALIWSCGTGKTLTAVEWATRRSVLTLIICPKALKANWERAIGEKKPWFKVMSKEEFRRDYKIINRFSQIIVDEVHVGFLTPNWKSQMSK